MSLPSPFLRKPLPPEIRAELQRAVDRLVDSYLEWHMTDFVDPGRPLRYRITLDLDLSLPEGRRFETSRSGDFPPARMAEADRCPPNTCNMCDFLQHPPPHKQRGQQGGLP